MDDLYGDRTNLKLENERSTRPFLSHQLYPTLILVLYAVVAQIVKASNSFKMT